MKVVHTLRHVVHNPRWEFSRGRRIYSKDAPSRATLIREALEACGHPIEIITPEEHPETLIAETHSFYGFIREAVARLGPEEIIYPDVFPLRNKAHRPEYPHAALAGYYCFDTATPLTPHTYLAAKAAVDVALTGADLLLTGSEPMIYALCRPPGHHAERHVFGGYSYFNNPGLAAKRLLERGRVAVLDIDYHHGNGTQDVFYESAEVLTISIHGDPQQAYPYFSGFADERGAGPGEGFNLNLPLPPGASPERFFETLDVALAAVRGFAPWALVLPVGFDTCKGDPAGSFDLLTRHYPLIARRIAGLGLPTLIVQEGGYDAGRLGRNAVSFLSAYDDAIRGVMPKGEKR